MPATPRNLYALIVGIDNYPAPVPRLQGCVNDAESVKNYLQVRAPKDGNTLILKTLYNENATRTNIVKMFESHLAKATANDIALFYYCGHGSQEPANEAFWESEPDRQCETLVCYDSRSEDGMDLADKELATLIDLVAKKGPHTVMIFDCCHSGTITRDLDDNFEELPNSVSSRTAPARSSEERDAKGFRYTRPLSSYLKPSDFEPQDTRAIAMATDEPLIVPNPRHVAISAALSSQTAKETTLGNQRRGVFTYSLVKTLTENQGALTYADIVRRVRALVANKVSDQNPQLAVTNQDDANLLFLNGLTSNKLEYFTLYYDLNLRSWAINGGAAHGMKVNSQFAIFKGDAMNTRDLKTAIGKGSLKTVEANASAVIASINLDTTLTYKAVITSLPIPKTKVFITGDAAGVTLAKQAMMSMGLDGTPSLYIEEVVAAKLSAYILYAHQGQYIITRYTDGPDKPITERLVGYTAETAMQAINNLEHIGKWENMLRLDNPQSQLASNAVKIQIYRQLGGGKEEEMGVGGKDIVFSYKKTDAQKPRFRVKLTNTSDQKLYCALLYLDSEFAISTDLFPEGGIWLESGEETWGAGGKGIKSYVPDYNFAMGKNEIKDTFKLIVSTEEFDPLLLRQNKLNAPKFSATRDIKVLNGLDKQLGQVQDRALEFGADDDDSGDGSLTDWRTNLLMITTKAL